MRTRRELVACAETNVVLAEYHTLEGSLHPANTHATLAIAFLLLAEAKRRGPRAQKTASETFAARDLRDSNQICGIPPTSA